jgi:CysZ protein
VRRLGFFDGIAAFFGGLGFLVKSPSLWGWALVPIAIAGALFFGLAIGLGTLFQSWAAGDDVWHTLAVIALWLAAIVVAFLLSLSLAQPLSGFALDVLVRRQEAALDHRVVHPDTSAVRSALRALSVTMTALAITLPILALLTLVTLLVPPASVVTVPLKFAVTGLAVAYDFLDYPLGLRATSARERVAFIGRHPLAVLGFGLASAACLLVPGVGLALLPIGAVGATRLVVASERLR